MEGELGLVGKMKNKFKKAIRRGKQDGKLFTNMEALAIY